jgi:chemotaxis protein methyltransferase CheR
VAVSVSGRFRDPDQFRLLEEVLLAPAPSSARLNVWSAGCADGTELGSVATLLERRGLMEGARLLGSDVLDENVAIARLTSAGRGAPAAFGANTRWERRDLVHDGPPPGRFDLVLCRNVLIYLSREARSAVHETLVRALGLGGLLLLGRSETLVRPSVLGLEKVGPHLYRRPA